MVVLFDENRMNLIGYQYLKAGEKRMALKIFQFNVQVFPNSWNVYDSLAEAYNTLGDFEKSIDNYNQSLKLNPENTHAADIIESLKKKRKDVFND